MRKMQSTRFLPVALFTLYLGSYACGPENALVGGQCAGARCSVAGDASLDGGAADGGVAAGSASDGSASDARPDDGSTGDGSSPGDANRTDAQQNADACIPPFNRNESCGTCGTVCAAPNSFCQEISAATFACRPQCVAPLGACGNRCVNKQTDPENCGVCGLLCSTFLCGAGTCVGSTPGDIVLVGHDFKQPSGASSQGRLLVNALFSGATTGIRVLSYEEFADTDAVNNAKSAIAALSAGRNVTYTVSFSGTSLSSSTLSVDYDAVLIYDQANATSAQLAGIGTSSASALSSYTARGGNVVVLDGGLGQMPVFLTNSNLISVSGHTALAQYTPVRNVAPSDAVGRSVASPYAAFSNSTTFTTSVPEGPNVTYVVRQGSTGLGLPVVIHKVVP